MRNCNRLYNAFRSGLTRQDRRFSTKSTVYNPKIVNAAVNPKPGKLFRSTPVLFLLGAAMLTVPLVVTHYDNKDFEKMMELRKQPGFRY